MDHNQLNIYTSSGCSEAIVSRVNIFESVWKYDFWNTIIKF